MITKENYFTELTKLSVELSKKNWLNYSSWADVLAELKKQVPDVKFEWLENNEWTLWFVDDYGAYAKVRVYSESLGVDVIQHLQVQDFKNQAVKKDKLDSNMINKTYQRCMVKAIATWFGLGLYLYQWEDLPETDWEFEFKNAKTLDELRALFAKSPRSADLVKLKDNLKANFK
jgi:hypothetical protein